MVVLMHAEDIDHPGLRSGELVGIRTVPDDRVREMHGFQVKQYDIPRGCIGIYYPEANALITLWHHAEHSKVPAAKSVPVWLFRSAERLAFR